MTVAEKNYGINYVTVNSEVFDLEDKFHLEIILLISLVLNQKLLLNLMDHSMHIKLITMKNVLNI